MATGTATLPLMDSEWPDLDLGLKRFSGSFLKWMSNIAARRGHTPDSAGTQPSSCLSWFAGSRVRGVFQTLFNLLNHRLWGVEKITRNQKNEGLVLL